MTNSAAAVSNPLCVLRDAWKTFALGCSSQAGRGEARQGAAWHRRLGWAWRGKARQGIAGKARPGAAGPGIAGMAWQGKARRGIAGEAGRGVARQGEASQKPDDGTGV
jgi:hypothetical protein